MEKRQKNYTYYSNGSSPRHFLAVMIGSVLWVRPYCGLIKLVVVLFYEVTGEKKVVATWFHPLRSSWEKKKVVRTLKRKAVLDWTLGRGRERVVEKKRGGGSHSAGVVVTQGCQIF